MAECAVIIQPKATMSEAERSRRLLTIYQVIIEALQKGVKEQGADETEQ